MQACWSSHSHNSLKILMICFVWGLLWLKGSVLELCSCSAHTQISAADLLRNGNKLFSCWTKQQEESHRWKNPPLKCMGKLRTPTWQLFAHVPPLPVPLFQSCCGWRGHAFCDAWNLFSIRREEPAAESIPTQIQAGLKLRSGTAGGERWRLAVRAGVVMP